MSADDDTHVPPPRGPGRMTQHDLRLSELESGDEEDTEVAKARLDMLSEFVNGGNFKLLLLALVAVLLGPVIILGTWAIDGGVRADGWGCYGTHRFCAATTSTTPDPD